MKKVLMIARAFPPFLPIGHSIRVVKFIKYLPALGWLPVILTVDDRNEYETLRKVGSETLLSEIGSEVKIYRTSAGERSLKSLEMERRFAQSNRLAAAIAWVLHKAYYWIYRNLFLPDEYVPWLPFAVKRGKEILKSEGIDVIFATCPPFSALLVGAFLKLFTGKPLILDYRDDWIDTPWYQSKPRIRRLIERKLESWAVRTADKVILVTEWSKDLFLKRYPKESVDKFVFISNGCDLDELKIINNMPEPSSNVKFTILHAGSLNVGKFWGRSPMGLFQAIQKIIQKDPGLAEKLTLTFAGDLPEEYQRLAEGFGLSTIIKKLGHLSHEDALRLIRSADLLLAINYEGWATLIPGKLYEYWAVGGPPILLLSYEGAAAEFIEKHNLGFTVEPYDSDSIQRVILNVYHQEKMGLPIRIKTAGVEAYDRQVLAGKLAQVLSTIF